MLGNSYFDENSDSDFQIFSKVLTEHCVIVITEVQMRFEVVLFKVFNYNSAEFLKLRILMKIFFFFLVLFSAINPEQYELSSLKHHSLPYKKKKPPRSLCNQKLSLHVKSSHAWVDASVASTLHVCVLEQILDSSELSSKCDELVTMLLDLKTSTVASTETRAPATNDPKSFMAKSGRNWQTFTALS